MNVLIYYILVSLLPILGNLSGFLVSKWSSSELEGNIKYLDKAIRVVFIFAIALVLSEFRFYGFIILLIFIFYSLSKYFWIHENINMLVFAVLIILVPHEFIIILIFLYFLLSSSISYYNFNNTKSIRFSVYPMHAINFMKKYWTYYMFILIIHILIAILLAII